MPWRAIDNSEIKNSSYYEPVYLSKEHAWKNIINFANDDLDARVKNFQLADHMLLELVNLLHQKGVDNISIRQALIKYIEDGTLYDAELHDFDKKVVIDCRAKRREDMMQNGGNL